MTKDEFKRQYIKWAGICGIAEDLGEDLDKCTEEIMQGIPPSILETAGEADIEKTTIAAVLSTRFARDWGEKTLNAQVALFSICCSGILYQMQAEIDALKEKLNTSTKFLKILHDEVADLADSCKICRKPAGACAGCVLLPCKETLECIDHMHPELIHQPEGEAK